MTPTEVHTSVSRCFPSATRVIDRCRRPARSSTSATQPLMIEATSEMARPTAMFDSGTGVMSRWTAVTMMYTAATKIMIPSVTAEKYSALVCPKWWPASGGRAATVRATSATTAATRLTTDSAASESSPTESVTQ